eukprot:CAMPEP_0203910018 /NCGR_PEP_ID=MMETSP0359-20131031/51264_1 /ASSEMBLY_ACC=CAM_ASM_000338 /TAXON_ID=268821 /ORGANISM="Scrippsiella Hangoei, Strain SHTV-5" /LENGTH=477 /DNA_ID=CAMNT_0050835371 /DNA_START=29 /DNA_END=1462 /DNA_ORIENTATION=+
MAQSCGSPVVVGRLAGMSSSLKNQLSAGRLTASNPRNEGLRAVSCECISPTSPANERRHIALPPRYNGLRGVACESVGVGFESPVVRRRQPVPRNQDEAPLVANQLSRPCPSVIGPWMSQAGGELERPRDRSPLLADFARDRSAMAAGCVRDRSPLVGRVPRADVSPAPPTPTQRGVGLCSHLRRQELAPQFESPTRTLRAKPLRTTQESFPRAEVSPAPPTPSQRGVGLCSPLRRKDPEPQFESPTGALHSKPPRTTQESVQVHLQWVPDDEAAAGSGTVVRNSPAPCRVGDRNFNTRRTAPRICVADIRALISLEASAAQHQQQLQRNVSEAPWQRINAYSCGPAPPVASRKTPQSKPKVLAKSQSEVSSSAALLPSRGASLRNRMMVSESGPSQQLAKSNSAQVLNSGVQNRDSMLTGESMCGELGAPSLITRSSSARFVSQASLSETASPVDCDLRALPVCPSFLGPDGDDDL